MRAVALAGGGTRPPNFIAALLPDHFRAKNSFASLVSWRSVSAFLANSTSFP
jgi:hypothetical protein